MLWIPSRRIHLFAVMRHELIPLPGVAIKIRVSRTHGQSTRLPVCGRNATALRLLIGLLLAHIILHVGMHFTKLFLYLSCSFIDRNDEMKHQPVSKIDQECKK